jgi:hypothetical protein
MAKDRSLRPPNDRLCLRRWQTMNAAYNAITDERDFEHRVFDHYHHTCRRLLPLARTPAGGGRRTVTVSKAHCSSGGRLDL